MISEPGKELINELGARFMSGNITALDMLDEVIEVVEQERNELTISDKIEAYVAECDRITREHMAAKYPNLTPDTHEARQASDKWVKVWRIQHHGPTVGGESMHSFVALCDFENKKLGKVKRGEIFMAANWAEPAKHARGSVFDADFSNCITPWGVKYLKDLPRKR